MLVSKVEYGIESGREMLEEAYSLAKEHYYEVEEKSKSLPFGLDLDALEHFIHCGMLFIVTARVDGKLVGYFANLVVPDIFTGKTTSKELGIFVKSEHRGSSIFYRMLKMVEKESRSRGSVSQMMAFKSGHDIGLAERCGYEHTETIYQKLLGD